MASDGVSSYERTTAPQSEYTRWTVLVGGLVLAIGVGLTIVVPLLFV